MHELDAIEAVAAARRLADHVDTSRVRAQAPSAIAAAARALLDLAGLPGGDPAPVIVESAEAIGMHPRAATEALRNLLGRMTTEALASLQEQAIRPVAGAQPVPPRLVFHVLVGNLFVSGIESVVHALLAGAASVVRCSAADRHFPLLWQRALAGTAPELARMVAVAWWPHDDTDATRDVAACADVVVAFGGDEAIRAIAAQVTPDVRFIAHGPRTSFALLSPDDLSDDRAASTASALAYDLSVYDQQGCLSPRGVFLPAHAPASPERFAALLAGAMRDVAATLPRRALSLEDAAALARGRDEAILSAAATAGTLPPLHSRPDDPFVITLRPSLPFVPGPADRFADLRTYADASEVARALAPWRGRIGCLGAGSPAQWADLATRLRAPRVCPLGTMQRPPLGWPHDGRPAITDLLDYTATA